jgi:hypothetical protein
LRAAEGGGVTIVLPWPPPWPQQLPDAAEVRELELRCFAGAPLGSCLCTDWAHARSVLENGDAAQPDAAATALACARVADACGLALRLPLGSGEARWQQTLEAAGEAERVLTLRSDVTAAEVARSVERLAPRGP